MKKLRIKLISPRMSLRPMDSEFKRRMSPPLSLVTLASLTPKHHEVAIEDENLKPICYTDNPDIVGITVNVDTAYRAFDISNKFRKKGVKVIFGGIHASADPEAVMNHCDAVCVGEAEEVWVKILDDLINNKLKPIYQHKSTTALNKMPIPDWDFVDKHKYLYNNIMVASRGCPFKCEFCYNSCPYIINTYRNRYIDTVINEIDSHKTRQIMFIDDNLIGNTNWTNNFLNAIEGKNLLWHGAVSTNLVKYPEMIKKMSDTGCRSLFIGFETINPENIKSVGKSQNKIEEYEKLIGMLHDQHIMVNASLVFGFDHDTTDTFSHTLKWLIDNKVETMTSHILTPYPGTTLYKKLKNENRIINTDLSQYNTANVVFRPQKMSAEELKKGYLKMYSDFYSFRNILRRKPLKKKMLMPYFMFNLGYRKFGKITSLLGKIGLMNAIGKLGRKLSYGID